ncbi:hypothetical protein RFI_28616 [Reticulomyxa filosa]|uniref:Peptidase A2 domain-containing protein n=1 Tax=Reticulomyxa filosa TaxID=46433 RepID=X6M4B3_RETFI|nr:hypothetical protein RFI_28616 [Reticulomyxa filosa]|eukprot:ETO08769.1 hypothetical protein RFI_28616 [Reticulomyxa filosa]
MLKCGKYWHKQRYCPSDKKEIQILEYQVDNRSVAEHILPMLVLYRVIEEPNTIEIELQTEDIWKIKAIADTGASICAVKGTIANTFSNLVTKDDIAFNVAHAGGCMTLQDKLKLTLCDNNSHNQRFQENFYVVDNITHNFILFRSILRKLGYSLKLEHERFEHVRSDVVLDGQDLESSDIVEMITPKHQTKTRKENTSD